jgi:hypothetical protein
MKNLRIPFLITTVLILSSCFVKETSKSKALPPGQAKKVAGTQSAKPFAPGQQKH